MSSTLIRSNYPEIARTIGALRESLSFNGRGRYRTLGTDVLDAVAQAIYDQTVLGQKQPDGKPLAPLAESTLRRKRAKGQPELIGVATGRMLAMEQIQGTRTISRHVASMTYGITEEEALKAEWFQEGHRKKPRRPKRPFYDLNARAQRDIDLIVEEALEFAVRIHGG